jgi:vitamin-K-epoxide reductase (warfarin-sensitive)
MAIYTTTAYGMDTHFKTGISMAMIEEAGIYFGSALGLLLSFYAIHLEYQSTHNADFVAICDINQEISCTKALTSNYKNIFAALNLIPSDSIFNRLNCEYGVVFYLVIFIAYQLSKRFSIFKTVLLLITSVGMILSVILGYIMITILKTLCLICIGTYLANLLLLFIAIEEYFFVAPSIRKSHQN